MNQLVNTVLVFLILTGFLLLASSRLVACIRAVAIQGMLLGLLAIASRGQPTAVWITSRTPVEEATEVLNVPRSIPI